MTVAPEAFVDAMETLWTETLSNAINPGFRTVWHTMASTFRDAITANLTRNRLRVERAPWMVLAPEMGAGKTVGAYLYLGLMARTAQTLPSPMKVGGLLVCRTIRQCEKAVEQINGHAGYEAAITRHSENTVSPDQTRRHPILVITHAALLTPDEAARRTLLKAYSEWDGGPRCLTIIDEALANAVDFHEVTEQSLLALLSDAAPLQERHQFAWNILQLLLRDIRRAAGGDLQTTGLWDVVGGGDAPLDEVFDDLLADLKVAKRAEKRVAWNDPEHRRVDLAETEATLGSIKALCSHWAMFARKGGQSTLMSARPRLPSLWSPVLLNATATQDVLLGYIDAVIVPTPKVRNYQNLTIRVLRSTGIGKTEMLRRARARLQRLGDFIRDSSEPDDRWLVVTHKGTEGLAQRHIPEDLGVTAHWGALDGLNDFRDCNKAVLFGLSYRDPTWSTAMYFAMRGMHPDDWFKSAEARPIKRRLEAKAMAAQVLQGLGRPRSRRVSDNGGNCLPTTVYLTLPPDQLGRDIERHIRETLPGVGIEPWDFQLDEPSSDWDVMERLDITIAVVTHMHNLPAGRYTVNAIADELDLSRSQKGTLKDGLKKQRRVYQELEAVGVSYVVEGRGRSAKSYLVKRD